MDFGTDGITNANLDNASNTNKSSTFAYSPDALLKVYWLQKRNNVLVAIEDYEKRKLWRSRAPTVFIYSRLHSLYLDLKPALKRKWKGKESKEKYDELEKLMQDKNKINSMLSAFDIMNEWLDDIGITRVDTRIKHNATNPEEENRMRGM
jgi:hypothetical protein